jgi:hypothetical protein
MNLKPRSCLAALFLGLLGLNPSSLHAQGMFSGNINGTPGIAIPPIDLYVSPAAGRTYTDLELTALTRAEEDPANQADLDSIGKLVKAATDAHLALVAASVAIPVSPAALEARAKDLADAELALANARATSLAALVKKILPKSDSNQIRTVAASMESRAAARVARASR